MKKLLLSPIFLGVLFYSCQNSERLCNLSSLKIKDVKIENDRNEYLARAIKSTLYQYGAEKKEDGVEIIGSLTFYRESFSPESLSLEAPGLSLSSVVYNPNPLLPLPSVSERFAWEVAEDLCRCLNNRYRTEGKK